MTAGPGPRVAALLALLRPVAAEIIVGLDDRADASVCAHLGAVADRVVLYPFAEPVDRPLPWLFELCGAEWALAIDDDEVPSCALLEALPRLLADETVAHYSIPRRWLYPTSSSFLDAAPWRPDYQLRLVRTDPRLIRFSSDLHRPIVAGGPGRFLDTPIWHLDAVLRTFEERRTKAWRYERARPGMRVGARALNFAFYLPESRRAPKLGDVPLGDRAMIDAVLQADGPSGLAHAEVTRASRDEIDAYWPASAFERQTGELELLEQTEALFAGEQRTLDVRVRNTGSSPWSWGSDCGPAVRLGVRWFDAADKELPVTAMWTTLPGPIEPGEADVVPVHVVAPGRPGRYRVEIDLLQDGVRWFGAPVSSQVLVEPHRRIAVAGSPATVESVSGILESHPELVLLVLRRSPSDSPDGYTEAPDCRSYLFDRTPRTRPLFAAVVAWRSARLLVGSPRRAREFVAALRSSDVFVAVEHDGPHQRREDWAFRLAKWKAYVLRVPVSTASDPAEVLLLLRGG